mmetsp:Transcript_1114/g.1008  ORF Transcript_1114/g.1008 Transcript_1114/m.1008 type:complete len:306 (+) Transcript_1114:247-1164(+)
MIKPMNAFGVDVACLGNHDFDLGLKQLRLRVVTCDFPWLLSNVKNVHDDSPMCGSKEYHILERAGMRIGFLGLAEKDWVKHMPDKILKKMKYESYEECCNRLVGFLRNEEKCDMVIGLTHMRTNNDTNLAETYDGLDLILGGHDHIICKNLINGTWVAKSGCEFRNFHVIDINKSSNPNSKDLYKGKYEIDFNLIEVNSEWKPDEELTKHIEEYEKIKQEKYGLPLLYTEVPLVTNFAKIRTSEQNLPNLMVDILRIAKDTDIALLNNGTFRSDCLFDKGIMTIGDLRQIIPFIDLVFVLKATGE